MSPQIGYAHWPPLALAFVAMFGLSAVATDALTGLAVVWAMLLAVLGVRRLGSAASWRLLLTGGFLIGFGPVLSGLVLSGGIPWTLGDVVAGSGYLLLLVGLERVLRRRTIAREWTLFLDATLVSGWLVVLALAALAGGILERTTPAEAIAAFSYLPFTFALLFQLLRLALGAPDRSPAVVLLALTVTAAAVSEVLFLASASGLSAARPVAIGLATAGLVLLSAAVCHPSASRLEEPVSGDFGQLGALGAMATVASIVALVLLSISPASDILMIKVGLIGLAVLMAIRVLFLLLERDDWVRHERSERELISKVMEAKDPNEIIVRAEEAIEFVLDRARIVDVGFWKRSREGWTGAVGEADSHITAESLERACSSMTVLRSESPAGPTGDYMTQLTVPVTPDLALLLECVPVLDGRRISRVRSIVDTVSVSLRALDVREQTHRERADNRFRALVQDSNDIVMVVNESTGEVEMVGPTLSRILGHADADYLDNDPLQHLHPDDVSSVVSELEANGILAEAVDVRVEDATGEYRWFSLSLRDLADENELTGLLYSFVDINERKMAELQLLTSESRYRALVKNAKDVFCLIDSERRITFVSPNVSSLLGYEPNDLLGTNARGLLSDRGQASLEAISARHDGDLTGLTFEVELKTAFDEDRVAEVVVSDPQLGEDIDTLLTVRDITEQRRLEESLRHQSIHDPLTGLFNRASLYPELSRGLQALSSDEVIGVLHLNVAGFRQINESVGFGKGDHLLIEIGSRLRAALRPEDCIARFNADEFAVVSSGSNTDDLLGLATRLLETFDEPFRVGDRTIEMRAVIGLDVTSDRRRNATEMIENAALAMRVAATGDDSIETFEDSMRVRVTERFELVADFRRGVDEDQFNLVYQPLFDLGENKVSSVEALLRWDHPDRGLISPAVFIPLAEESGFIVDLGKWVLRRACEQLVEWHEKLPNGRSLSMSVNVSTRQLENHGDGQALLDIIDASGVDKTALTLELTETVLIEDAEWLRHQLQLFRHQGIRVAVDDFGAGAAGLNHLRDVPFDVLKIDKSYIDNVEQSKDAFNLVSGVIELAHGLDTQVVAEGIETPMQALILRQMGCDYGQGFYLGRPMAPDRIEDWFAQGREASVASAISHTR